MTTHELLGAGVTAAGVTAVNSPVLTETKIAPAVSTRMLVLPDVSIPPARARVPTLKSPPWSSLASCAAVIPGAVQALSFPKRQRYW